MSTNPEIFKAYDIRGIYGRDLDEDTAYRLGRAYADMRRDEGSRKKLSIAVGRDMRKSSVSLKKSLMQGLADGGAKIFDIGLVSTPAFYFAVGKYKLEGGIVITASHNPAAYNGFKLVREKARPIGRGTGMEILKEKVLNNEFTRLKKKIVLSKINNITNEQIKHDFSFAKIKNLKSLKIAADAAHGMGAQYLNELFKNIPGQFVKMYFKLDGSFPAHEADPLKPENLKDLEKKIKQSKADLGIATDGDGDRVFFLDELGQTIEPGVMRAILAEIFLKNKPGATIAYDIRPGKITADIIKKNHGRGIVTPVGHSLIKEIVLKEKAYFAGESSGHFFLNLPIGCFEMPVIMILEFLKTLSASGLPVSEFVKPYQKYAHSGEINFTINNKDGLMKALEKKYRAGKINKLDGITITYPDFWFNVRGSNTEPKVRLNLEASDEKIMKGKLKEITKIIKKFK